MKFGLFYEHQTPRPWTEGQELKIFQDALDEIALADRIGIDHLWLVEHHFLEEYAHSSAPEVFLGACSQRTKRMRLGHGIALTSPRYNHPARVAERIATLDLVSKGRVEFGTGESSAALELEGFNIPPAEKRAQWREGVEQCVDMLAMTPYPGFEGTYFSMPVRNVVPKPVQRPHPPLWVACSNRDTIRLAAELGMGALTFAFVEPEEAKTWVDEYYAILKSAACVPIGHAVNPNVCMVSGFSVHPDEEEARRRGLDGFRFFSFALGHMYGFGEHKPGVTDVWDAFEKAKESWPASPGERGVGTPAQVRTYLEEMEEAGVDQVAFLQQGGRNDHGHICEALTLFGKEILPPFRKRERARARKKAAELKPFVEAALLRRKGRRPLAPEEVPTVVSFGRRAALARTGE